MQSKVSVRGQTVIPAEVRQALGIKPKQRLNWELRDGSAVVRPLPDDPFRASIGILKGVLTYDEFMKERNEDRAYERDLDRRDGIDA